MANPKDQAIKKLTELVKRFDEQYASYKNSTYNETQTRRDFIDPFFKSLGWDVDNEQGYAESYREVIHEDRLKISGVSKAPDYSFRLVGGKKLFFVEAKKPSVLVKEEIPPAYQIRRYGWSAKLPISIITDFEEFSLYDCTVKPNPNDKASTARIKYLNFRDYAKEFDFFWETFGKENVLKGSFDKFVKSDTHKKGTATVDKEFLQSLDEWRTYLATSIAINNKKLDEDEINFVVQQIIDRLIFLRIAEDRNVEPFGNLKQTLAGDHYKNLFNLFKQADDKYNSGLFDFKKDKISEHLTIDNKVLKNIITDMYYPSPFAFDAMPVEIMGTAYEQFLGKVIRITPAHHAKIEEKPEVRKAGGVYYTPQYIVDYIVKNTVGKHIEGKKPDEISKLKIVDPACGSGSFLIGAYQFLLDFHKNYYTDNGKKAKTSKGNLLTPEGNLTTSEKKRILLNNIFGVDIDANAVEVTKLSLLLKCMEGETEASISNQMKMFHERVLPTLDENIKCGNSLIDVDFYSGELDFGEDRKVKPFNWKKEFREIFKNGGFDAVIGNPPYVRQELLGDPKKYFEKHYKVYHGMADLYSYFIEKGIELLNKDGLFGIIVANKWMRANYGENLRRWIKSKNILEIIDFGELPVFSGATTYPCILIVRSGQNSSEFNIVNVKTLSFDTLDNYVLENKINIRIDSLDDNGWNLVSTSEQNLINKIKSKGIPLNSYLNQKIFRGILTGYNEAFIIENTIKNKLLKEDKNNIEVIKPFIIGRDIKRYKYPETTKYIIFTKRGIEIEKYPSIKNYLLQFKKQLMPKPKDFKGTNWEGRKAGTYKWYEIQDSTEYYKEFEKPKIAWGNLCKLSPFTIIKDPLYINAPAAFFVSDDFYLLGLLNSNLLWYYLKKIAAERQGGFIEAKPMYVSLLPIKVIRSDNSIENNFQIETINLVHQLLELNKKYSETNLHSNKLQIDNKIKYIENKINEIVYQLYGLTKEEIEFIENNKENQK